MHYNIGSFWRDNDLSDEAGEFDIPTLEDARRIAQEQKHDDRILELILDEDGIPIEAYFNGIKLVPEVPIP